MKHTPILFFLCLMVTKAITNGSATPQEDDGVLLLDEKGLEEAIKNSEFLMVHFFAPWSGHCKHLAPTYAKAAKVLAGLDKPIPAARVDGTKINGVTQKYGVQGYSTIKFFVRGTPITHRGERTVTDLVKWAKHMTAPFLPRIETAAELEELKKAHQVLTIFFGQEDSKEYNEFEDAAISLRSIDTVSFAHTSNPDLIEANGGSKVTTFTRHNNKASSFDLEGQLTKKSVLTHVNSNRFPAVMEFEGKDAYERFFNQPYKAIIYFSEDKNEEFIQAFTQLAEENINKNKNGKKIAFFTSGFNSSKSHVHRLRLDLRPEINLDSTPAVWIVDPENKELPKIRHQGELTADSVRDFLKDWRENRLDKYYKSAPIPENNDGPIKEVVGRSFKDLVVNNNKYVLLWFYSPKYDYENKIRDAILKNLAKKYSGHRNLVLAKIDNDTNQIPGIQVTRLPEVLLFAPRWKSSPIHHTGDRGVEGIERFLKEKLGDDYIEAPQDL